VIDLDEKYRSGSEIDLVIDLDEKYGSRSETDLELIFLSLLMIFE